MVSYLSSFWSSGGISLSFVAFIAGPPTEGGLEIETGRVLEKKKNIVT